MRKIHSLLCLQTHSQLQVRLVAMPSQDTLVRALAAKRPHPPNHQEEVTYDGGFFWCENCEDLFEDSCPACGPFKPENELFISQEGDLVKTHTGDKPYQCGVCGKTLRRSNSLVAHMRKHTGEKPYHCDKCGKAFSQAGHLARHKWTHTGDAPYQCCVCIKAFSDFSFLVSHERTHTGEKPYQCDKCGKAFSQAGNLVRHKRTHTGEKPYQ